MHGGVALGPQQRLHRPAEHAEQAAWCAVAVRGGGARWWCGRLVEGCLSTLLPRHNEARGVLDRATAQRTALGTAVQSAKGRLLRKVISSRMYRGPTDR